MKKVAVGVTALLALGIASASADEMVTAPSAFITAKAPYFSWSGLYAGINGGYGLSNASVYYAPNDPAAAAGCVVAAGCIPTPDFHRTGPLAGGQVGYNWQFNTLWLAGIEADYQWARMNGTGTSNYHITNVGAASALSSMRAYQNIDSFGSLRARMGAMVTNALLLYGTAGIAFGYSHETLNLTAAATGALTSGGFSYSCVAGSTCFSGSSSKSLVGWIGGTGAEYAVTSTLTFKTEVLYMHLDSTSAIASATAVAGVTTPASFTGNFSPVSAILLRGGLNLRF